MRVSTIFGPPGTGKTRTLVDISKEEVERGNKVLFMSYTRAAAAEAASRVGPSVKSSTVHSIAYSALGVTKAQVVDKDKLAAFGDLCGVPFASQVKGEFEQQEGDVYCAVLSYAKNRIINPWEAYDKFGRPGTSDRYHMFMDAYHNWKHTYGYLDFDDMLERVAAPNIVCPAYPIILLDEAQDCSPLQWLAFANISNRAERIYIAGDDDQAIYEWGGADPHGMVEYAESTGSVVSVLDQSHRVPRSVLDLVKHGILNQMVKRKEKHFNPTKNHGTVVRYGDIHGVDYSKLGHGDTGPAMVLVRDRWRMKEIRSILDENLTPYTMNGAGPYETKYAHAIRAVLKLNDGSTVTEQERSALVACGSQETARAATAKQYISIATKEWKECLLVPPYLQSFYRNADLFAPPRIALLTIHGAKGGEAHEVVVDLTLSSRVEENCYADRDAELRVMYVAMTRAKDTLILCGENLII